MLEGRQLLLEEVSVSKEELYQFEQEGYIRYEKGVVKKNSRYMCQRCGNEERRLFFSFQCDRCRAMCMYCRKCIMMGRVSECTKLVRWTGPIQNEVIENSLKWDGQLSEGQRKAADGIVRAVQRKESFFVWAVCGAGKTEMLFHGIQEALHKGERICIATPRTDVVLELYPRLQEVFPSVSICALYGGSDDLSKNAQLVISTTHQLLRYYRAFDVMIVDEIDAFPYSMDDTLQYAVRFASKENASFIYLTATPPREWQRKLRNGKQNGVIIPARYHRYPLPVPLFRWCGNWRKSIEKETLPANVLRWFHIYLEKQYPMFLFVPHVCYVEEIVSILKCIDHRIEGVHAEDAKRKEKVASFRKGEIPLLVTTTILERGVTVSNLQVAVLGAEEQVFSESALVQIAGRAGRSRHAPSGDVIYFHYGKTEAMVAAKKQIQMMNKRAKQEGFVD
ncbi:DEAD/DEAH box helicase [Bacillus cytotoxicus]|uniref:DEAD/DEAH box helicase n=1 Tax=Bacillus cytotoxicus TaxID=580165 RepID=A0ACC6A3G6_9BACI|nr:DEAD/DEAH box helicase [Bacillus cytotoxicus]